MTQLNSCFRTQVLFALNAAFLILLGSCASVQHADFARQPAGLEGVPIVTSGGDETAPVALNEAPIQDKKVYDAVVVGGGLSGLSAAVYLTDRGHSVLLLEKQRQIGGLAAWAGDDTEIIYDRGAAYWTDAYEEEQKILDHIGLKDYRDKHAIPEPIDSYFVRGHFYAGIWDEETLKELPASFELFRYELQRADANSLIPNQPFEDFALYGGHMDLDNLTTRQWIEQMPAALEAAMPSLEASAAVAPASSEHDMKTNPHYALSEAQRVLARFHAERDKLAGSTGMQGVVELMDLYCRSALGAVSSSVSAMAFANFYISEIDTRYTSPQGTGIAADNMVKMLKAKQQGKLAVLLTGAPVTGIVPFADHAETQYNYAGHRHVVHSKYMVFSAQLKLAPQLIKGFITEAPEQAKLMSELDYSNYSVHAVHLDGHPYRASYDTWMYPDNYSDDHPTDVILGRWMDPKFPGYVGYRDFKNDPPDSAGILTIYHPLSKTVLKGQTYNADSSKELARDATEYVDGVISSLPPSLYRGPIKVTKIETNLWPISVHVPAPGHYLKRVAIMRKPFKRVFFGNNNLGAPAFEEALFRGHCAAVNVLLHLDQGYQREEWSRCPID